MTELHDVLLVGLALFALGVYGILARRSLVGFMVAVHLLFQAAAITLLGFTHHGGGSETDAHALVLVAAALLIGQTATSLLVGLGLSREPEPPASAEPR